MTDRFKCPWCSQHFRANPGDHVHCPKCRTLLDTSQIPRVAEPTPPPVALTPPSQNPASTAIPPKRPTFLDGWKKLIDPLVDQTKRILEERQQNVERRQQAEAERIARAKAEAERIAKVRADAYAKLEVWKRENPERAAAIAARAKQLLHPRTNTTGIFGIATILTPQMKSFLRLPKNFNCFLNGEHGSTPAKKRLKRL